MTGLRWTTAGESHGPALIGVLEGMPAGLALDSRASTRSSRGASAATGAAGA
jgi:chorismate synthase